MSRYPMCKDQPAQIDCRNTACKYHVNAACTNVSPAIVLMVDQHAIDIRRTSLKAVCWSFEEKQNPAIPSNV
jgi:hypothetical protein